MTILDCVENKGLELANPSTVRDAVTQFLSRHAALAHLPMQRVNRYGAQHPSFMSYNIPLTRPWSSIPGCAGITKARQSFGRMSAMAHMFLPGKPIHDVAVKFAERDRIALHLIVERDFGR